MVKPQRRDPCSFSGAQAATCIHIHPVIHRFASILLTQSPHSPSHPDNVFFLRRSSEVLRLQPAALQGSPLLSLRRARRTRLREPQPARPDALRRGAGLAGAGGVLGGGLGWVFFAPHPTQWFSWCFWGVRTLVYTPPSTSMEVRNPPVSTSPRCFCCLKCVLGCASS